MTNLKRFYIRSNNVLTNGGNVLMNDSYQAFEV